MTTHISNSFSFARLMMVLKHDFVENWKNNLNNLLSIYGAFLISALMSYATISDKTDSSIYFAYRLGFFIAVGFITFFVLHINAAHIMDVMNTKEKRIAYLMLPATKAEKFVSRAIQVTVGTFVMIIVTLFLAEITRLMLFPLIGAPETLQHFCLFDFHEIFFDKFYWSEVDVTELEEFKLPATLNVIAWFLVSHSAFILGGTYFYKRPVVKTFGTIVLGFTALSFILSLWNPFHALPIVKFEVAIWTSSFIALVIIVANWALSYFLFTRSQVTERVNFKFLKRG